MRKKFRPLIVYHGHSDGAQALFGFGMTREYQDYAREFLRQGYTVFAPDQRGFRKRLAPAPISYRGATRSCRQLAFDLMLMGRTIMGERVSEGMALFSWIRKMDTNNSPIVVTGNSGGGTLALLHAAIDTRVSSAMLASAFCTFKDSIMELQHCECNYIPGVLKRFQEIWEIGAIIAPRPILVIHGKEDHIFPIKGVRPAVQQLRRYYAIFKRGASKNVIFDEHDGGHRYAHRSTRPFLDKLFGRV